MQAPVICQLCGQGFLETKGLWKHAAAEHHSWAECRQRLIYEVGRRVSVPLQPVQKRRLVGNIMHVLLYSHPGRDTLKPGCYTMRQVAACAVCAGKGWLEDFYPCYLFNEYSASSNHGEAQDEENVAEQDDEENADEEELAASIDIVFRDSDNLSLPGQKCSP